MDKMEKDNKFPLEHVLGLNIYFRVFRYRCLILAGSTLQLTQIMRNNYQLVYQLDQALAKGTSMTDLAREKSLSTINLPKVPFTFQI